MARTDQLNAHAKSIAADGWPSDESAPEPQGFAGFNAQLTLLGAVIGLLAGAVAASLLKSIGASSDLVSASVVYVVATIASVRLQKPAKSLTKSKVATTSDERDRQLLNPNGDREVSWGLTAMALVRFSVGFATFLLAFGLRREHAGLSWFAFALSFSGIGAMLGLAVVTRVRSSLKESTLLTWAILFVGAGGVLASMHSSLWSQIGLAGWLGFCGAVAQPSFDAITQRNVPAGTQGRTFARFAVRQQLLWVIGALLPVGFTMTFSFGDRLLGCLMLVTGLFYGLGRRFAR
jgi:MFS family permease